MKPRVETQAADSDNDFNLENLLELEEALEFNEPDEKKIGNKILDLSPIGEQSEEQSKTENMVTKDMSNSKGMSIDDLLDLPSESMSLSVCSVHQSFVDEFIL